MSLSYFIVPYDPALFAVDDPTQYPTSDLRIDPQEYTDLLLARCPGTIAHGKGGGTMEVWMLSSETLRVDIHLQDSLQVVSFDMREERRFLIDFILWHRSIIPARYELYLAWESSWFEGFPLKPDITAEMLLEFMDSKGWR